MQDPVLLDVRQLSSGTVANLCGSPRYTDIDAYRNRFVAFVVAHLGKFETWQDAHKAFADTRGSHA